MEPSELEHIRRFSRAIFGNRHALEVLAAIGKGNHLFYVQGVATQTGIPSQTIRPIVRDLIGELAQPLPRMAPNAAHYHERVDHPVWQMAVDLLEAVKTQATAEKQ